MRPTEGTESHTLWRLKKHVEFFLMDVYESQPEFLSAQSSRAEVDFRAAETFLRAHLTDPLTVSEIATACSISVSRLKLLFREKTGGGLIHYRIHLRIEEAKRLIDAGELNFTEIAAALGFESLHYFSRMFKKITGMTPSGYARRPRG